MLKLKPFLSSAGVWDISRQVFIEHPVLKEVVAEFVQFFTPLLVHDGENIGERALSEAFAGCTEGGVDYQEFITTLCKCALTLSRIRVSVPDEDQNWHIWAYEEPLAVFMKKNGSKVVQIRKQRQPVPVRTIITRLLAELACKRPLLHVIDHQKVVETVAASGKPRFEVIHDPA
jgi:hypothetical protein